LDNHDEWNRLDRDLYWQAAVRQRLWSYFTGQRSSRPIAEGNHDLAQNKLVVAAIDEKDLRINMPQRARRCHPRKTAHYPPLTILKCSR
jgi:hypothetical protein